MNNRRIGFDRELNLNWLDLAELIQSPAAFPFDLAGYAASVRRSDRFEVNRQGLDLEMVAPRVR